MKIYRLMECMDPYENCEEVRGVSHNREAFDAFIQKYYASEPVLEKSRIFWVEEVDTEEDTSFIESFMQKETPVYEDYDVYHIEIYRLDNGMERVFFVQKKIRILKDEETRVFKYNSDQHEGFQNSQEYLDSKKREGTLICFADVRKTARKAKSAVKAVKRLYEEEGGVLPISANQVLA